MSVMPVMQKHSELFSFFDVKFLSSSTRNIFAQRLGDFDGILDLWRLKLSEMCSWAPWASKKEGERHVSFADLKPPLGL